MSVNAPLFNQHILPYKSLPDNGNLDIERLYYLADSLSRPQRPSMAFQPLNNSDPMWATPVSLTLPSATSSGIDPNEMSVYLPPDQPTPLLDTSNVCLSPYSFHLDHDVLIDQSQPSNLKTPPSGSGCYKPTTKFMYHDTQAVYSDISPASSRVERHRSPNPPIIDQPSHSTTMESEAIQELNNNTTLDDSNKLDSHYAEEETEHTAMDYIDMTNQEDISRQHDCEPSDHEQHSEPIRDSEPDDNDNDNDSDKGNDSNEGESDDENSRSRSPPVLRPIRQVSSRLSESMVTSGTTTAPSAPTRSLSLTTIAGKQINLPMIPPEDSCPDLSNVVIESILREGPIITYKRLIREYAQEGQPLDDHEKIVYRTLCNAVSLIWSKLDSFRVTDIEETCCQSPILARRR